MMTTYHQYPVSVHLPPFPLLPLPCNREVGYYPEMESRIVSLIETLDDGRKNVLAMVRSMPERLHVATHDMETWTPLAIVEHLIISERSIFAGMPTPGQCHHKRPSFLNRLNRLGINTILRFRFSVPPPSPEMIPSGTLALEELDLMWGDDMAWLRHYCNSTSSEDLRKACFQHPVAGPLTLKQALIMAVLHIDYHLPTLEKRIRA